MEEILASIRRIISDDQPNEAEAVPAPVAVAPAPVPVIPVPKPVQVVQYAAPVEIEEDVLELTMPIMEPVAEPVIQTITHHEPEPYMEPAPFVMPEFRPSSHEPMQRLIEGETDKMVSNAFGSLAHTVLTQNARTLDDVVKDMLRPMLKGWLDDNLPTIVERLVRAEIERVARGGR